MNTIITVLAPIMLAAGKTEAELLAMSEQFQHEFVQHQTGILRRELVRRENGQFMDIIQFKDHDALQDVMQKEQRSEICQAFFALMDMEATEHSIEICQSLASYPQ